MQALEALRGRPRVDVLVLNAGLNSTSRFELESSQRIDSILRVNCVSAVLLLLGLEQSGRLAEGVTVGGFDLLL
jgi:short-subunit dehydrogenase